MVSSNVLLREICSTICNCSLILLSTTLAPSSEIPGIVLLAVFISASDDNFKDKTPSIAITATIKSDIDNISLVLILFIKIPPLFTTIIIYIITYYDIHIIKKALSYCDMKSFFDFFYKIIGGV